MTTQKFSDVQARILARIVEDLAVGSLRHRFAALAASNPHVYRTRLAEFSENLRACEGGNEFKLLFRLAYYAAGRDQNLLDFDPLGVEHGLMPMESALRRLLDTAIGNSQVSNMHPRKAEVIAEAQAAIYGEMQRHRLYRPANAAAEYLEERLVLVVDGMPEYWEDVAVRLAHAASASPKRRNADFNANVKPAMVAFVEHDLLEFDNEEAESIKAGERS